MAKQKFYVVWEGVTPGVYTSWTDCQLQIKGYEAAKYKSFDTREEAERALLISARMQRLNQEVLNLLRILYLLV